MFTYLHDLIPILDPAVGRIPYQEKNVEENIVWELEGRCKGISAGMQQPRGLLGERSQLTPFQVYLALGFQTRVCGVH